MLNDNKICCLPYVNKFENLHVMHKLIKIKKNMKLMSEENIKNLIL